MFPRTKTILARIRLFLYRAPNNQTSTAISPAIKISDFVGIPGGYEEGGYEAPIPIREPIPEEPGFEVLPAVVALIITLAFAVMKKRGGK